MLGALKLLESLHVTARLLQISDSIFENSHHDAGIAGRIECTGLAVIHLLDPRRIDHSGRLNLA